LRTEVRGLKVIFDEHPGLQDRFIAAGRVAPELADQLGLCGLAGRASGMSWDLRVQFPPVPYDTLNVRMATHRNGDVAARVTVRFEEVLESLDLCWVILDRLPRGEVLVALETGPNGSLRRVHPHDPSWQNWPLLEHAVIGNIVPDFPLINKSFNLTYSGVDL
jgi:Ni,Fe-hydrogenase III large subunit